jgi:hypothetical protein
VHTTHISGRIRLTEDLHLVVDSQIHLWPGEVSSPRHESTPFTVDAISEVTQTGVDAAIVHPPGWDPTGARYAFDVIANYPDRFRCLRHRRCRESRRGRGSASTPISLPLTLCPS